MSAQSPRDRDGDPPSRSRSSSSAKDRESRGDPSKGPNKPKGTKSQEAAAETPQIKPPVAPPKVSRHIQPLGPRVLVRLVRGPDRSESGLFLPAGAKENHSEALLGEVIEVARAMPTAPTFTEVRDDDDGEAADLGVNVSGIPLGAQVLFTKEHGTAIPWDENLRLLEVRRILAIVETITEDELQ